MLAALLLFPLLVRSEYILNIAVYAGIYIILTSSLNITNGYTGLFSFGHAAFYGIGAYAAAILATHSEQAAAGCDRRYRLTAEGLIPLD